MQRKNWTLAWNDAMSVGIAEIDGDHKQFLALVDEFNKSVEIRMGTAEIQRRLQNVVDDAVAHLAREESLLQEWGYPDADDHARLHTELIRTLDNIKATISHGYDAEWVEAGMRIKNALLSHIQGEDSKFAEFFRSFRAGPGAGEK